MIVAHLRHIPKSKAPRAVRFSTIPWCFLLRCTTSTPLSRQALGVIRGRLRPLTKNAVNGTYVQVLPIDGIFAECSTRHPSDAKMPRTATHDWECLRTTENACVFQQSRRLVVPSSRCPAVSLSRRPVVPQSRSPVVSQSRCLAVSLSRSLVGALPSHSQSFPVVLRHSQPTARPSANRAPLSQPLAPLTRAPISHFMGDGWISKRVFRTTYLTPIYYMLLVLAFFDGFYYLCGRLYFI